MEKSIKLLILGDGPYAMEVADLVSDILSPVHDVVGYVRSERPFTPQTTLLGKPVYWVDDLDQFSDSCLAVCALGSTRRNNFTQKVEEMGFGFATIIHPTARVSRTATVGAGSIINAGALIASHTEIGRHVIINRGAMVGHHIKIGDYVTISPGANLAASVEIGSQAYVGMGAIVLQTLKLGERTIVAAGSVVTRDVPPRTKVMGVPAKIVAERISGL